MNIKITDVNILFKGFDPVLNCILKEFSILPETKNDPDIIFISFVQLLRQILFCQTLSFFFKNRKKFMNLYFQINNVFLCWLGITSLSIFFLI